MSHRRDRPPRLARPARILPLGIAAQENREKGVVASGYPGTFLGHGKRNWSPGGHLAGDSRVGCRPLALFPLKPFRPETPCPSPHADDQSRRKPQEAGKT
jgi:hypothetical protein